jgi:CheY-like chemotaxis protein
MHGKIGLESTPGQGSRFVITFRNIKYSDEIVEQEGQFMWDEENIVFKGSKILIVDDVPHNRNLVRTYFEAYDLNIYEAGNGEMAIQMAQEVMPDLIFMDIRMPGLNGYQATELIKSVRATAGIPVIALTASTMQSEINKLEKLFDGYLRKPVQKKTLLNELIKRLPCDILKPAAGNDTDTREKVLKMKAVEIPNEVKILFGQAFSEKITSQSEFIRVDDLIELTKKIESFAVQHKIPQLKAKCDDLNNYVEAFNFEQIQSCLITIKEMFHDKDQVV